MYFVHTWAQQLLGQDLQEDYIKLDLDLEKALTVKVIFLNYAKNPISLLLMSSFILLQNNAYGGTETLKLTKIKIKF